MLTRGRFLFRNLNARCTRQRPRTRPFGRAHAFDFDSRELIARDSETIHLARVRKRGKRLIGHALVRVQPAWCRKEGVQQAIITHCGSEIVTAYERKPGAKLCAMATEPRLKARIAYDGMELILR